MSREKLDHIVSGALFDFLGFLTCREEVLTLSAKHEAGSAVLAVREFMIKRGIDMTAVPLVQDWALRCGKFVENVPVEKEHTIYMPDHGMPIQISKALEIMTDEWVDKGNCTSQTVIDLRDALIAALKERV